MWETFDHCNLNLGENLIRGYEFEISVFKNSQAKNPTKIDNIVGDGVSVNQKM